MKKHEPVKSDIYGFPLYYRIEYRKITTGKPPPESESECETTDTADSDVYLDIPIKEVAEKSIRLTLIISYRKEVDGALKMVYEGAPISGQDIVNWLGESKTKFPNLNDLPYKAKQKFLSDFIGKDVTVDSHKKLSKDEIAALRKQRDERQRRRKEIEELTFGIMFLADENLLNLIDDDKRVVPKLLKRAGSLQWKDAIPEKLSWLAESSEHERKQVKRIMKKFFYEQTNAGICEMNPWLEYDVSSKRNKLKSGKYCTKKYVEVVSLTKEQCSMIFSKCRERLKARSVNGIDIAVLLMLTLDMDECEICALNLENFSYLKSFNNRLTVKVTHEMQKVKQKHRRREISDPYQSRIVPVISLVRDCWECIRKAQNIHLGAKSQHPLVPLKVNKERRATPSMVVDEIIEYVESIDGFRLRKVTSCESIAIPKICDLLKNTAFQRMHDAHLEDEEIRAVLGISPVRVSGKHYYDRFNDAAINKIGSLLDRWTRNVETEPIIDGVYYLGTKRHKELVIAARDAAQCVQVTVDVLLEDLTKEQIPEEGIELEVCSFGGMSGIVIFEE